MQLIGAAAIVAGGAAGLGAATVRRLGEAGAKVVILDLDGNAGATLAGEVGGVFVRADVTDADDVQAAVERATALAPLRVLINCAGVGDPGRTLNRDGEPSNSRALTASSGST